jgi:hypothetical protein
MEDQTAQFQKALVQALNSTPLNSFDFSRFVEQQRVPRDVAGKAAEAVLAHYCGRTAADGVITDVEQARINRLAALLEIPAAKAAEIAIRVNKGVYLEEQRKAQADGIITAEEDQALQQLRESLRLAPTVPPQAAPAAPSPEPPATVVTTHPLSIDSLRRTRIYRASAIPLKIERDLADVRDLDRNSEVYERAWLAAAIVSGVIAVGCFLCFAAGLAGSVPLVGVVLGIAAAIFAGIMKARYGRLNLNNRRYTLASELVRHLSRDMAPDSLLDLTVDFNSYHQKQYCTSQWSWNASSFAFALPWLTLKGAFLDGNRFRLAATLVAKRKDRRKRKYTKVKKSFREKISLSIVVKAKRYPNLQRFDQLIQQVRLPQGVHLQHATTLGNRITVQVMTDCKRRVTRGADIKGDEACQRLIDHHTILGLFLAIYHCLAQCRSRKSA